MHCFGYRSDEWNEEDPSLALKEAPQGCASSPEAPSSPASECSTCASLRSFPSRASSQALVRSGRLALGDFDVLATVGKGTYGRVCAVHVKGGMTPLALKIMKKARVEKMDQVEHVRSEMSIMSAAKHPFIVSLLRTFEDEKRLFLLMEFVNGGELFTLIRSRRRLENAHAKFYAAQITLVFEYLHGLKVAYRDLKPENVLIDCEGYIKLTDFGYAKVVEDRTYTACCTPEYVAPEVILSRGHNGGVDWWALGILIYEMLQGDSPFACACETDIYEKALAMKVRYPMHFNIQAKSLVGSLLTDESKRLGCLARGAEDIKKHSWFRSMDWQDLLEREIAAPWIPTLSGPDDTSWFRTESKEAAVPAASPDVRDDEGAGDSWFGSWFDFY